jgi:hypothetical protein
MGGDG